MAAASSDLHSVPGNERCVQLGPAGPAASRQARADAPPPPIRARGASLRRRAAAAAADDGRPDSVGSLIVVEVRG